MKLAWSGGKVTAAWDRPSGRTKAVLVLAHGAGGDLNDPVLQALAGSLAGRGVAVLRFNFPYREAGRKAPGSQKQSEECYREMATSAREKGLPLFCGGKSYGGRIASHVVSDGFDASGLVFLSYPLHPPGRPERIRDAHLPDINAPMLFLQGTRDNFAQPDLLRRTLSRLDGATYAPVEGGDHSLRVRGRKASEVADELADAAGSFIETTLA